MLSRRLVRSAALVMLLLAGGETLLCQMWSPASCQFSQNDSHDDDSTESTDDCLCCCVVEVGQMPIPEPSTHSVRRPDRPYSEGPGPAPVSVYHPPVA